MCSSKCFFIKKPFLPLLDKYALFTVANHKNNILNKFFTFQFPRFYCNSRFQQEVQDFTVHVVFWSPLINARNQMVQVCTFSFAKIIQASRSHIVAVYPKKAYNFFCLNKIRQGVLIIKEQYYVGCPTPLLFG